MDLREQLQSTLGNAYTIERELAGGGMARVFVADEIALGRKVVIKILPPEMAAHVSMERFRREIQLAARLQHPHIVPLHTAGDVQGMPYFTMPFVEGESLTTHLANRGEYPVAEAVRLLREIAAALAYAHEHGIVHRDIKPGNVLVSGGSAMVTDFGVAKAISASSEGEHTITGLGMAVGTPAYMAPEQASADPSVDHRADIYAFGIVAYELLTGRPPFAGRPPHLLLAAQVNDTPEPVIVRRSTLPPTLGALVMRCLEKRPADRPQTANEIVRVLDDLAIPSGSTATASIQQRRRTTRSVATAAGLLALVAIVGALVMTRRSGVLGRSSASSRGLVDRRVAVAPFENQTGDAALAPVGRLTSDWITQGIAEAGFAEVVDPQTVQIAMENTTRGSLGLAAETGARFIVTGAYYREGDSIRVLGRITDAAENKLVRVVGPVSATPTKVQQAIAILRERILGAVGALLDVRSGTYAAASTLPPSLGAYQRWSTGVERFYSNDFHGSAVAMLAAARMDSTFVLPVLWAAGAYINLDSSELADSLLDVADRSRDRLPPQDRYLLDVKRAELHGDIATALEAAREMVRTTPGSGVASVVLGWDALRVNRPREGIAALVQYDLDRPPVTMYAPFWDLLTQLHHANGDHRTELTVAESGRRHFPDRPGTLMNEARALAALGRADDVLRTVEEAAVMSADSASSPADDMRSVGMELRAHGHGDAADSVFRRALSWYRAREAEERNRPSVRAGIGATLYAAGRWDEARREFDALARDKPGDIDYRGYLGVLAARRGDRSVALSMDGSLASLHGPYMRGRPTYWRARIAALLGDGDRAIGLLRESLQQGREYPQVHVERDFEVLREMRAFRELMRVKG